MKPSAFLRLSALVFLLGTFTLAGCGGAIDLPDSVASSQASGPAISGTVYGGHAPITGAHVYLLQPSTSAYGGVATSLLGNNGATSANGYTLYPNVNDPSVPTTGTMPEYVLTDSNGAFSLTGAYKCTVGQPVYVYAYGGSIGTNTSTTPTTNTLTISAASETNTGGKNPVYTYTFTAINNGATPLAAGDPVTLTLTDSSRNNGWSNLNGTQTVVTATAAQFTVTGTTAVTNSATGTATYTTENSSGSNTGPANSSIVQLATLGNCPSSGNFSTQGNGALSYVYLNEVSTVATAYTFQPFTLATNNDAWHIGTSGSTQALLGIANAADTAAQLYDIQGSTQISTTQDGEGHLANYQTQLGGVANEGNGVVPQATIDTLANILADCVDSVPVSVTPPAIAPPSAQCKFLFSIATDDGTTTGTNPTDTATAAINIARYPAGNSSSTNVDATYASDLFVLQNGTVPYTPGLSKAPNDWTLAIDYPYAAVAPAYATATNSTISKAESIQVDANGELWITAQADFDIVRWSPLGVQNSYYSSAQNLSGPANYIYGYVSIDGSNNAWTGNANSTTGIQQFNSNGVLVTTFGSGYTTAYTIITDSNDNAYFFASNTGTPSALYDTYGNSEMSQFNGSGTLESSSPKCDGHTAALVYNCISQPTGDGTSIFNTGDFVAHGAIEDATYGGHLWLTSENSPYQIARVSPTGVADWVLATNAQQPEVPALDANGNGWIPSYEAATIYKVTSAGASTTLTSASTGAALVYPFGAAVDGNGNVWVTNRCGAANNCTNPANSSTLVEIDGANSQAISPPTNYLPEAQYPASATTLTKVLTDPLNVAIDPSGNIWITNYDGTIPADSSVVELVGAAAPVVTPLSYAAGSNKLGTKP